MPEQTEVLTNVPTEFALRRAEIDATRALTVSVEKLTDRMDNFGTDLGEIKSKVTTIEARNFDHQIAKLEADTEKSIQILHDSNKARDLRADNEKQQSATRFSIIEKQMSAFGAYLAFAGAIGGACLGVIANKVFGG